MIFGYRLDFVGRQLRFYRISDLDHAVSSEIITMQLAKWPYILFLGRCYFSSLLRFWLRSRHFA